MPMSSMWNSNFLPSGFHTIVSTANRFRLRSLVLLSALVGLSFTVMAQQATIVGTVTDQSGAASCIQPMRRLSGFFSRNPMIPRAHGYLAEADRPAIVSPLYYNAAGIYYEQNAPIVLPKWRECGALGATLHSALQHFSMRDQNLRESKKTEWPSYLASHCRSVREFESTYLCIARSGGQRSRAVS